MLRRQRAGDINLAPDRVAACLSESGIGFMFAPSHHVAMKHAAPVRKELGIRTIYNIRGPLTNPAGANVQVLGVYDPDLTEPLAKLLGNLGARSAFVVFGEGSFDEISIVGPTRVSELKDGKVATYTIAPEDFGLKRATLDNIKGGDVFDNAKIVRKVLAGEGGPREDMVALNAAAAFIAASLSPDFPGGPIIAQSWLDQVGR